MKLESWNKYGKTPVPIVAGCAVGIVFGLMWGTDVDAKSSQRVASATFDNVPASRSVHCDGLTVIALGDGSVGLEARTTQLGDTEKPIAVVLSNYDGSIGPSVPAGERLKAWPMQGGLGAITVGVLTSEGGLARCPTPDTSIPSLPVK
ncbi:MAG: hypothetical protein WAW63_02140 [Candidatus Saccharimonadales bacterium]|nr:hypothetical protein [Candidatus Saccharibacteria bacterium]